MAVKKKMDSYMTLCSSTSTVFTGKRNKVKVEYNPVDELLKMKSYLPENQSQRFRSKYGEILNLLQIPVQADGIRALTQYWDNKLRCFVFSQLHLSLTIEEYAGFLKCPLHQDSLVYNYPGSLPSLKAVAHLLGRTVEDVPFIKRGQSQAIPLNFLLGCMEFHRNKEDWSSFSRILALSVYGTVLFPFAIGTIDLAAISVFQALEHHHINPVPAILADTFQSLSFCQEKGSGKLKCCLQLLTVWMANHMLGKKGSIGIVMDQTNHPLKDFHHREGAILEDPRGREGLTANNYQGWMQLMEQMNKDTIRWKLVWWENENILYSCGEFQNVPLMGPRGGINYNPSLAHLQFVYSQDIPSPVLTEPWFFKHDELSASLNAKVNQAWRNIRFKGRHELGIRALKMTKAYEAWINTRQPILTATSHNPLLENDPLKIEKNFKAKIEGQKDELDNLRVKRKRQEQDIQKSQEEYAQLRRELTSLKKKASQSDDFEKMKEENERLKEEIVEMRHARRKRDSELHNETEAYRVKCMEGQAHIFALQEEVEHLKNQVSDMHLLEDQLIEAQGQWGMTRDLAHRLHEENDQLRETQRHWREMAYALRKKQEKIAHFINSAVPTFADTFADAERSASVFNTPKEVEDMIELGNSLVNQWNQINRRM